MQNLRTAAGLAATLLATASLDIVSQGQGQFVLTLSAAEAQAPSVTATATQHYNAGRLTVNQYIAFGAEYGYLTPFTLFQLPDGSWTDEDPSGGGSGGGGGGGGGGVQPGSWQTRPSLAGMEVHVYTPNSVTTNGQRALMVSLHGCAQANEVVRDGWGWENEADQFGMVVAAPDAPNGGVIFGCWDYYDSNHRRSNPGRHDDNLINLVNALLSEQNLNIDPDQVYITGLSSGGGQSFVMGCLAPEIFAGMGIAAGPAVGTSSSEIGSVATTAAQAANTCRSFANAGNQGGYDTQVTSVIAGTSDFTVAQGYANVNADAMASIYGASQDQGTNSIAGGGTETTYSDNQGIRIQRISVQGLEHAWPAGSGASGGAFTNTTTVDYPAVVTQFFFDNNRRATFGTPDTTPPAVPAGLAASSVTANSITLAWGAVADADLANYSVYLGGSLFDTTTGTELTIAGLSPETTYSLAVSATDQSGNESALSQAIQVTTAAGGADTTPPAAPTGLAVTASSETSLTLDWDDNGEADLANYRVFLDGAPAGTPASSAFTFGGLLAGSTYELSVAAVDIAGNVSQSSSLIAQTDDPAPTFSCQATTSNNFTHVSAGRAVRCGAFNSNACAVGSGDNLGLWNVFVTTTVAETSEGFFELGSCPQ